MTTQGQGGRTPRAAAGIAEVAGYLDDVVDELDRHGFLIESVEYDLNGTVSGRLLVSRRTPRASDSGPASVVLVWTPGAGWSMASRGRRSGWRHLGGAPVATPTAVAGFVQTPGG